MEKLYSKIINTPIFQEGSIRPLTTLKSLILNPDNGRIEALAIDFKAQKIISPIDIITFSNYIRIHDGDNIIDSEDIIKVQEILKSKRFFAGNKVMTKDNIYIGKVVDYSIDITAMQLKSLIVAKDFLGLVRYGMRIIPYDEIVEVSQKQVTIKSDLSTLKEPVLKRNIEDFTA